VHTTLITPAALVNHLDDPSWVIVDCRFDLTDPFAGERQFLEGHIPGARYAHLDRDLSATKTGTNGRHPLPSATEMAARFGRLGIGSHSQVVAYDADSGMYAARLWWMLRYLGHTAVAVLDGGFARWTAEGGAVVGGASAPEPVAFHGQPRTGWMLTVDEVAAIVRHASAPPSSEAPPAASSLPSVSSAAPASVPSLPSASSAAPISVSSVLVDARSPERFRGVGETLDKVGGHIPGATSCFFQQNLAADKTFKPAAELRAQWDAVLQGRNPADVVMYCGSGVTACHNLLSMEVAGLPGARIFPGSWSEWSADPSRPVVTD